MRSRIALAGALSLLLNSCQPPQQVSVDVFRLEGQVMVPQQDQSLKSVTTQAQNPFLSYLIPPAHAATGLTEAPAGVQVRLIRIDDEGRPVSNEPLATTQTDAEGRYSLDVPTSVSLPATNVVLEVGNYATGKYLRNFATQGQLDLNPVTTAFVQLMVDRPEPLFSLPLNVVQELRNLSNQETQSIDYATVDLATSLNTTLSSLKANATLNSRLDQLLNRVISGKVMAPNGRLAAASNFRIDRFLIPPAEALTGIQPVSSNVTVTLSKIDNNGNVMGLPLATTKTASDGSYAIVLPAEAQLSSEYIVSVGSGPALMRSMLSGTAQLDISPLSEATTRLVLNNGTVLSQPKIPITEYSAPEIIAILDAAQRSTANTSVGGANTVSAILSVIQPIIEADAVVQNNLKAAGGLPAPALASVSPVTSQDTITLSGTATAGSLITVEGGTQLVSTALGAGNTSFQIQVPLKRNSNHILKVRAVTGGTQSLAAEVQVRTDTLNPRIVTDKIIARNPSGNSFETIITGGPGAIDDGGRANITISGPKLGNATQIQTAINGSFEGRLAADSGDVLTLTVIDEAGNRFSDQIVVGGPGPVVTNVQQETTILRNGPFAERVVTLRGGGFDSVLAQNVVSFVSPRGTVNTAPRSVSADRREMVVPVPRGLVDKLSDLPTQVTVQVSTNGIASNANRDFTLFPEISVLSEARLESNGQSDFFYSDLQRQNLFFSQHINTQSSIVSLDTNGNVLNRDIAKDITTDSIFRDMAVTGAGDLLVSNMDAGLVGRPRQLPEIRPSYRVTQYQLQGAGAELKMTRRLAESANLGAVPGAMAYSANTQQIYVALPAEGRIVKMSFVGNVFGRPETLISGLPTPIKDLTIDVLGRNLYISLGTNLSVYKLTLNNRGESDLLNSNFSTNMGNGNGHMALDAEDNLFVSLGTGIERINNKGQRISLVPILEGQQPTVGLGLLNNQLYVNQLNSPDLFRVAP